MQAAGYALDLDVPDIRIPAPSDGRDRTGILGPSTSGIGLAMRDGEIPRKGQAPASERITARIQELRDWRGEKLELLRRLIHEADPAILEEWKWETPVWSHDGIVCTGETYKQIVKLTFAKGAFLADPHRLFNAGLTGNVRRAIDLRAEDEVDGASFRELIREAVAFNRDHPPKGRRS
jgi:hypothetical protein